MTVAVSDLAVPLPTRRVIEVQVAGERLRNRHRARAAFQRSKRERLDKCDTLALVPRGTETKVRDGRNDGSGSGSGAGRNENSLTECRRLAGCLMRISQRLAPNWDSHDSMRTFRELAR